jgi:hypothetical protein
MLWRGSLDRPPIQVGEGPAGQDDVEVLAEQNAIFQ